MSENLLDFIGYHEKWHGSVQNKRKKYKYNQNDFLIQEIFRRIGIQEGVFLEFGAIDGIKGSNSRLLYESGWKEGILIESDHEKFLQLQKNYSHEKLVYTFNTLVDCNENNLDSIIKKTSLSHIDFCSIDIDGLDLKVFKVIKEYMPDVVCIEGGQCLDPFEKEIPEDVEKNNIQQSLETYCNVFKDKGYVLLASYQDNIFIKKEYEHLFNVSDKDIVDFYIEGILAYPRIPWLVQQCIINKIHNRFLNFIISEMDVRNIINISMSDTETKSNWVDENYEFIREKCEIIIQNKENIV